MMRLYEADSKRRKQITKNKEQRELQVKLAEKNIAHWFSWSACINKGCKKKRSHRDFSRSRKLMLLHRSSKLEKVKGDDKPLCSSDNVIDLYEKEKTNDCQADTAVNASNSKISEKLLPLNKRKSRYYVLQEDDGNAKLTNEENSWSESEEEGHVKIRSLSSIYKRARMVPTNFDLY